jgi:hypothetical protein
MAFKLYRKKKQLSGTLGSAVEVRVDTASLRLGRTPRDPGETDAGYTLAAPNSRGGGSMLRINPAGMVKQYFIKTKLPVTAKAHWDEDMLVVQVPEHVWKCRGE